MYVWSVETIHTYIQEPECEAKKKRKENTSAGSSQILGTIKNVIIRFTSRLALVAGAGSLGYILGQTSFFLSRSCDDIILKKVLASFQRIIGFNVYRADLLAISKLQLRKNKNKYTSDLITKMPIACIYI